MILLKSRLELPYHAVLIIILICIAIVAPAQSLRNDKLSSKSSFPEKWWAIGHPFVIKKSIRITKQALMDADSMKTTNTLDKDLSGGQLDAFKHSYWMALLVQEMKWKKALRLGIAHEKGNYKSFKKSLRNGEKTSHDKISSDMDLWNNQMGIEIGMAIKNPDRITIQQIVIDSIQSGKMKIIWKNKTERYLNCEGEIIPTDSLSGKWKNNKCLVPSNRLPQK